MCSLEFYKHSFFSEVLEKKVTDFQTMCGNAFKYIPSYVLYVCTTMLPSWNLLMQKKAK
jgi:hypothetical protein